MIHPGCTINRPVDLSEIDAIGFDLDHTLIDYDDPAVNAIATEETCEILVDEFGYQPELLEIPYDHDDVIRGLVLDLEHGGIVKLDRNRRVSRSVRAGRWLERGELDARYGDGFPFTGDFWVINSPFDLPTAFLFQTLSRLAGDGAGFDSRSLCARIRSTLDRAHVRGRFKPSILTDIDAFVRPQPAAFERVAAFRRAGKRVFVVTNSPPDYTARMLAHAVGDRWHEWFDFIAADAAKPCFFEPTAGPAAAVDGFPVPVTTGGGHQELERRLGASGPAVLFVGDNPWSDMAASRRVGWRTAMVVPELRHPHAVANGWGSPLADARGATWFAGMIAEYADVYAPTLLELLSAPKLAP